MSDWHPICEVPDGVDLILGYDPEFDNPVQVIQRLSVDHLTRNSPVSRWGDAVYGEWFATPTHFQILPDKPEKCNVDV